MANQLPKLQSVGSFQELAALAKTPRHDQQPNRPSTDQKVMAVWLAGPARTTCITPWGTPI